MRTSVRVIGSLCQYATATSNRTTCMVPELILLRRPYDGGEALCETLESIPL